MIIGSRLIKIAWCLFKTGQIYAKKRPMVKTL